jgi:hypothetical protein
MPEVEKPRRRRTRKGTARTPETAAAETASAARWVHLDELTRWARNPRKNDGDNKAAEKVAQSIRTFGFIAPIVVWTSRKRLVAGDTRIKALRSILEVEPGFVPRHAPGVGMVPVREVEFASESEANAYALADNKLGELAEWDTDLLGDVLRDMDGSVDLSVVGWSDRELSDLMAVAGERVPGIDDDGINYEEKYAVLVHCTSEEHQKRVFEELQREGYSVKVLAL